MYADLVFSAGRRIPFATGMSLAGALEVTLVKIINVLILLGLQI